MSELCGLRKREKTQQAFVGLGSAALVAAAALPQVRWPKFPERAKKVCNGQFYFCRSVMNRDVTARSRQYTHHVAIKGDHTIFGFKCVPAMVS